MHGRSLLVESLVWSNPFLCVKRREKRHDEKRREKMKETMKEKLKEEINRSREMKRDGDEQR